MIGKTFQPGAQGEGMPGQSRPSQGSGVQEAIKVLSLRLPKVVGAQAAAPHALLQGAGSGGSRVDSIVNQVMSRIMPQGQPSPTPMTQMPMTQGPSFSGSAQPSYQPQAQPAFSPFLGQAPRVVIGEQNPPPRYPGQVQTDGGAGQPPAMIDTLPPNFTVPSLPAPIPDVFGWRRNQGSGGGTPFDRDPFSI